MQNRPEMPGARYYEEPSLDSDCAVKIDSGLIDNKSII